VWCGPPGHPLTSPFRLYNPFNAKTLNQFGIHPRKVLQCCRHQRQSSGDISLCSGTLSGWGIAPEPSPSTPPPSPSMLLTPMTRRE
jgi:hypothetical protein